MNTQTLTTASDALNQGMSQEAAIQVLREVKARLGRCYKQAIRSAWMNGRYYDHHLEQWDSRLQQMRNQFGPSWLISARP